MSIPAHPLLHGYVNSTHTSNLTAFYPPQNLPTPWPLLSASLVFSLAIGCYGIPSAFRSWTPPAQHERRGLRPGVGKAWLREFRERRADRGAGIGMPRRGKKMMHPVVHESELEDLHKPEVVHPHRGLADDTISRYEHEDHVDLKNGLAPDEDDISYRGKIDDDGISKHETDLDEGDIAFKGKGDDDMASKYSATDPFADSEAATLHESMREVIKSPKWNEQPLKKVVMMAICAFCIFRAAVGFSIAVAGLINHKTPAPAPSVLLLLLISIQIFISNRSLPRLMTLILTVSAVLAATALLIVAYAPLASSTYPSYATLSIAGGSCAVPASDCHAQTTHWTTVGCANYTYYRDLEDSDASIPESQFYAPYATSDDVNTSANPLRRVETVTYAFATLWLPMMLLHAYEARHLFVAPAVLSNLLRPQGPNPRARDRRHACGAALTSIVALLGLLGAFVAAVMGLAAHVSQAVGLPGHSATYIDSVGPGTWANFTTDSQGIVTSVGFWGNETDWNDCFTVTAPTMGTGWAQWTGQSGGWEVVRIVAGL